MKKCPQCGTECDDEANFCSECETDLRENANALPDDAELEDDLALQEEAPAVTAAPPPAPKAAPAPPPAPKPVAAAPAPAPAPTPTRSAAAVAATQTGPVFFSGNKAQGGQPSQPNPASQANTNQAGQAFQKRAESHIVKVLISTLCCCPPFGIVALLFASQVNGKLNANDYDGALEASKKANYWSNLAIALALLFITVSLITGMLQDGGMAAETFLNMYKNR